MTKEKDKLKKNPHDHEETLEGDAYGEPPADTEGAYDPLTSGDADAAQLARNESPVSPAAPHGGKKKKHTKAGTFVVKSPIKTSKGHHQIGDEVELTADEANSVDEHIEKV